MAIEHTIHFNMPEGAQVEIEDERLDANVLLTIKRDSTGIRFVSVAIKDGGAVDLLEIHNHHDAIAIHENRIES